MSVSEPRALWRQYIAAQNKHETPDFDMRVAIAGSMIVEPLEPFLGAHLVTKKFKPRVTIGPFNQLRQICDHHNAVLGDDFDVIALLWRLEDLFPNMLARCLSSPETVADLLTEVKLFAESLRKLRGSFGGTLIVSTPPYPSTPGYEVLDIGQASAGMTVFNRVSQLWTKEIT